MNFCIYKFKGFSLNLFLAFTENHKRSYFSSHSELFHEEEDVLSSMTEKFALSRIRHYKFNVVKCKLAVRVRK